MSAPEARAGFKKPQMNFGGHCIKKFGRISSRTLTDFARSARVVALTRQVRSDCPESRHARSTARLPPPRLAVLPFFLIFCGGGSKIEWTARTRGGASFSKFQEKEGRNSNTSGASPFMFY